MRTIVLSLILVGSVGATLDPRPTPHAPRPTPHEVPHLRLTRSEPAADTTTTAVTAVKLWFSQPVELGVTTVRLTADGNRNIELAALTKASREVGTPVVAGISGAMEPGRYTVTWRTMSRDGHAVNSTFAFTLAAAAGTPAQHR